MINYNLAHEYNFDILCDTRCGMEFEHKRRANAHGFYLWNFIIKVRNGSTDELNTQCDVSKTE